MAGRHLGYDDQKYDGHCACRFVRNDELDGTVQVEWCNRHAPKKCHWTQDECDGSWDTECGGKFCIEEGTPPENEMRFCCYCGSELVADILKKRD